MNPTLKLSCIIFLSLLPTGLFSQAAQAVPTTNTTLTRSRGDVLIGDQFSKPQDRDRYSKAPFATYMPEGPSNAICLKIVAPADDKEVHHKVERPLDLTPYRGMRVMIRCLVKASGVTKPPQSYNGIKVMLHHVDESGEHWNNEGNVFGTFDWRVVSVIFNVPRSLTKAELVLGLEACTGTAWFHEPQIQFMSSGVTARPAPMVNPPPMFKGHDRPRLRGVMSPNAYNPEDFEEMARWNINLVRWQLGRSWGKAGTDTDLNEYQDWVTTKIAELDRMLPHAARLGIKVVIDLHAPPGGRLEDRSMRMFYEKPFQDAFVKTWERMATHFKGNPAVWGYDLINEPVEVALPAPGMGYLETQERAARAVRAIDGSTPIIIESEQWDSPAGFENIMPIPLFGIIYQVHMYEPGTFTHQGIYGSPTGVRYPGKISGKEWNVEALKAVLAPVRQFQLAYNAHIYVGEFSAVRWAPGADQYLTDVTGIFEEYGWDWSYHAFREWPGWSVEYEDQPVDKNNHVKASRDTERKKALTKWFAQNVRPGSAPAAPPLFRDDGEGDVLKRWRPAANLKAGPGHQGQGLVFDLKEEGICTTSVELPGATLAGKAVRVSAWAKGTNISTPPKPYHGVKLMLVVTSADGKRDYPQAPAPSGSFDWRELGWNLTIPPQTTKLELVVGLEKVSGTLSLDDLSVSLAPKP